MGCSQALRSLNSEPAPEEGIRAGQVLPYAMIFCVLCYFDFSLEDPIHGEFPHAPA